MLREIVAWTVVLVLVGSVCGFAWLTRNPESPWLERAEEWPGVGPLAERFRRAYLGPPPDELAAAGAGAAAEPEVVIIRRPPPDEPIRLGPEFYGEAAAVRPAPGGAGAPGGGDSSAGASGSAGDERRPRPVAVFGVPVPEAAAAAGVEEPRSAESELPSLVPPDGFAALPTRKPYERTWLLPGTVLRAEPAAGAAEVERSRELASVPILERRGEWLQVRLRGAAGWADLATPSVEASRPGRGSWAGRHTAQPWGEPLTLAKKQLGLRRPNATLGPFELYTDVEDEGLLELLGTVAERIDEAYVARFGIALPKRRPPTIALFAEEAPYRAVVAAFPDLPQHARGFAQGGLGVFYVGDDPAMNVIVTFVHEMTHVYNRHAIGLTLPPWLEEGLAHDLGDVWMEDPHAPAPGLFLIAPRARRWMMQRILVAALAVENRETPVLGSYGELLTLDRPRFHGAGHAGHNLQSALFVRCLLDGGGGETADGFRRFLADVAGGYPPRPERLTDRLGRGWPEIERSCLAHRRALVAEAERLTSFGARPAVGAD